MNKKIFIVLALASLFIVTEAAYAAVQCNSVGTTNDANCKNCPNSAPATCTACNTGYYLASGICVSCAQTGCAACTSATVCTTAMDGYFLTSGTVAGCQSTTLCKTCTSNTVCTVPAVGSYLVGTVATTCAQTGCATCSSGTTCLTTMDGYWVNAGTATGCQSTTLCKTCTSSSVCTVAAAGAYLVAGVGTACNNPTGCTTCTAGTATTCTAAAALNFLLGGNPGTATACGDTLNCAACSAVDTCTTCTKGTIDTQGVCCGVKGCTTCNAPGGTTANTVCATCASGYLLVSGACNACSATNCAACTAGVTICSTCATGYAVTGGAVAGNTCVATTPIPSTNSPATAAFNVTPTAVFLNTETSTPAFTGVSGPAYYGPGFDSSTEYVWVIVVPTVTGVVTVNRRTLNGTYGGSLAKLNSSDSAITTSIPSTAFWGSAAVAPGYFAVASYVAGTNWGGMTSLGVAATATASEISVTYIAVNGTSATTKAITGNTNSNVYFQLASLWIDTGVIYITYAMATHTPGTAAAGAVAATADAFAVNGIYIQGITISTGALLYNTTGGVKAITITQSVAGTPVGCINAASSGCASNPLSGSSSSVNSFTVGATNITNSTTVNYLWSDKSGTGSYQVIKTGTITLATGAATSGTALSTEAAATGTFLTATTAAPYVSTSYYPAGFLGSYATSGVFIGKTIATFTGAATPVYTNTLQGYINGSSTAAGNVTIVSGYFAPIIQGYGTSDGFVLVEQHSANTSPTNGQNILVQIERFFTNGSTNGAAVNLGTYYQNGVLTHQDANGSIYLGYTVVNTITPYGTYSGMLGKYLAQSLAAGASTLTSIFAFLSLLIVALFAF